MYTSSFIFNYEKIFAAFEGIWSKSTSFYISGPVLFIASTFLRHYSSSAHTNFSSTSQFALAMLAGDLRSYCSFDYIRHTGEIILAQNSSPSFVNIGGGGWWLMDSNVYARDGQSTPLWILLGLKLWPVFASRFWEEMGSKFQNAAWGWVSTHPSPIHCFAYCSP